MSLIRFIFSGDTKGLDTAGKSAKQTLADVGRKAREGATDFAKWGAAGVAASAAVAAAIYKSQSQIIDSLAKTADALNVTTQQLQAMHHMAELNGVSTESMNKNLQRMEMRLGEAIRRGGAAAEALGEIGVSVDLLRQQNPAEQMETLARAIGTVEDQSIKASISQDLFGREGLKMLKVLNNLSRDGLQPTIKELDDLGVSINRIDAAQVEAANDAMFRASQVVTGLKNRFTIELAPAVEAVTNLFLESAKEAEGFGQVSTSAADRVVRSVAFAMDAVAGLKRTFVVAGQTIAEWWTVITLGAVKFADFIVNGPIEALNKLISLANSLPGDFIDLPEIKTPEFAENLKDQVALSKQAVKEGWATIQETLNEPLPGGQFLKFVDEARAAADEAAKVAEEAGLIGPMGVNPEAPTGGFGDDEREAIAKRLDAVRAAHETELQALQAKFAAEDDILSEAREAGLLSEEQHRAELLAVEEDFQKEKTRLENEGAKARQMVIDAENQKRLRAVGQALSDLSTLMNSESRKMFEVGKAAAIAQTVMSTYEGAQKAYTALAGIPVVGPALGAAAAAAAIAGGVARVQSIRSQSFGGGGAPATSNTQAVNNASTPTGGGTASAAPAGPAYHLTGLDPAKNYSGRDIAAMLENWRDQGGRFSWE